jgi:hypothetical protein
LISGHADPFFPSATAGGLAAVSFPVQSSPVSTLKGKIMNRKIHISTAFILTITLMAVVLSLFY